MRVGPPPQALPESLPARMAATAAAAAEWGTGRGVTCRLMYDVCVGGVVMGADSAGKGRSAPPPASPSVIFLSPPASYEGTPTCRSVVLLRSQFVTTGTPYPHRPLWFHLWYLRFKMLCASQNFQDRPSSRWPSGCLNYISDDTKHAKCVPSITPYTKCTLQATYFTQSDSAFSLLLASAIWA